MKDVIEVRNLRKCYGQVIAVDGLSFEVRPVHVTGFLGPNGAGKSTTMRAILGLDAPTSGEALIGGRRYVDLKRPMHRVGALLDASAVHPGRTASDHLRCLALTNGISSARVRSVLELVGLGGVAGKKVGGFSLGMKQRLGIAAALLGDPGVLLFDEPVNGLDPEGVRWIRNLMRGLASEGRAVLLSSHLMSEMALTTDRLIIIGRGRLIADTSVAELTVRFQQGVLIRSSRPADLTAVVEAAGATVAAESGGALLVTGIGVEHIGDLAAAAGIPVYEMVLRRASLEDAYTELTAGSVEYRAERPGA